VCYTRVYPKVSGLAAWIGGGRESQMVQLSATRCSCIAILWVSQVSFAPYISLSTQSGNFWILPRVCVCVCVSCLSHPSWFDYYNNVIFSILVLLPVLGRCAAAEVTNFRFSFRRTSYRAGSLPFELGAPNGGEVQIEIDRSTWEPSWRIHLPPKRNSSTFCLPPPPHPTQTPSTTAGFVSIFCSYSSFFHALVLIFQWGYDGLVRTLMNDIRAVITQPV
jgi:hypothetical protein